MTVPCGGKATRTKWKGSLIKGNEQTLTFTWEEEEEAAIGRPFCHHGDQVGTLGKDPEVIKMGRWSGRREGGSNREGRSKAGKEEVETNTRERKWKRKWCVERSDRKKKKEKGGRRSSGTREAVGGRRGLSAFDVKSLRQKRSGAECCSTCSGNRRWQRQHGDGEDEGGGIKRRGRKKKTGAEAINRGSHGKHDGGRHGLGVGKLAILTKT